ncbi:P-loop containing nucleoside triphosphate hydrolase protein [Lipomyces oligophaga]|uniref:P-loop containing nucleoside triphosphate hydrolase protein n=1 Tax=Lipomyces oligophaga TaxID=45792 RepID=UPI0034CE50FE
MPWRNMCAQWRSLTSLASCESRLSRIFRWRVAFQQTQSLVIRQSTVRARSGTSRRSDRQDSYSNGRRDVSKDKVASEKVLSFKQVQTLVSMRLDQMKSPHISTHVCKTTNIDTDQFTKFLAEYSVRVSEMSENQFLMQAPKLVDYMRDRPGLPHAAVIRELLLASPEIKENIRQIDRMLLSCFTNFISYKVSDTESETRRILTAARQAVSIQYPHEAYPRARAMKRKWILHVGPTNSGKTYNALQRLKEAESGFYAGPLRLLAREVFDRFQAEGIPCNLVTGEEVIKSSTSTGALARKYSSTVEMISLSRRVDVAVIDEIQMISDPHRGWAWTEALLGTQARELHLCGEERTVDYLRRLATSLGDEIVVNRYKRLSPLEVEGQSLNSNFLEIRKGDAVIAFSRYDIFELKKRIEKVTPYKCAVVYGTLPSEIRAEQARLFNSQNNSSGLDVLVASDAVGMGLNLSINRVIFSTLTKYNGANFVRLDHHQIKQIAGRAGRYRAANENLANPTDDRSRLGLVTTLVKSDLNYLGTCMVRESTPIFHAGIMPDNDSVTRFAKHFPVSTNFASILIRLYNLASASSLYSICSLSQQISAAGMMGNNPNLLIEEKVELITAPANERVSNMGTILQALAEAVAEGEPTSLIDIKCLELDLLTEIDLSNPETLRQLESYNNIFSLYIWLSFRFPVVFYDRSGAEDLRAYVQRLIGIVLETSRRGGVRRSSKFVQLESLQQLRDELEPNNSTTSVINNAVGNAMSTAAAT